MIIIKLLKVKLFSFFVLMFFSVFAHASLMPEGFGTCVGNDCPSIYWSPIFIPGLPGNGGNCGITNGSDTGYSVFIGGDLTSDAVELEGLGLVAGNLSMSKKYSVGFAGVGSCTTAPLPGDQIHIGGTVTNAENFILPSGGTYSENGAGINNFSQYVQDTLSSLQDVSACLATFDQATQADVHTGVITFEYGMFTLDCDNGLKVGGKCPAGIYLFEYTGDVEAGYISSVDASNFPTDASASLIVNMLSTDVTVHAQTLLNQEPRIEQLSRYLLWNFPNATNIHIKGTSQFDGMVLAPKANVTVNASGMNGRFVAGGDVHHAASGGEFHNYEFAGAIPDACNNSGGGSGGGQADLELSKVANNNSAQVGDTVIYTLTLLNNGPDDATNVKVEDILPDRLMYIGSETAQGSYDPGSGIWTIASIPTGQEAILKITVKLN